MLRNVTRAALALVSACSIFGLHIGGAAAQAFAVTIAVDENCNGALTNTAGFSASLPCSAQPDGSPGGLPGALTYDLLGGPGLNLTDGDLILTEVGGLPSEVIRFNGTGATAALVFYSDFSLPTDPVDALADTGLPTAQQPNSISSPEVGLEDSNGFTYIPLLGQPGAVTDDNGVLIPTTYLISSDTTTVPEPGSLALLGLGVGLFSLSRRRQDARAKR